MSPARSSGAGGISAATLASALGGFVLRDEELELAPAPGIGLAGSGPRAAACAGVDGDGRVVIALRARGPESVLAAIDALAWCDARGDLLARRFSADEGLAPCVVLIVDEPDAPTIAALATLRSDDLRVFEARTLRTARGIEQDLAEISGERAEAAGIAGRSWDERLGAEARGLVDRVREGIVRIDPDARAAVAAQAIVWRRGSATLVSLRAPQGRLEAEVGGERFGVSEPGDVERILEGVVRAWIADGPGENVAPPEEPPRARIPLMPTGPLLSGEELAALSGN